MRLHLDTSFLVDWQRLDARVLPLCEEIVAGVHVVTIDPIVETEFFSVRRVDRQVPAVYRTVVTLGGCVAISSEATRLAASWLAPMDERMRRAHFADALIGAVAMVEGATLVTSDTVLPRLFPVAVLRY